MHRNPVMFAGLLREAAEDIETQEQHPGQVIPGVWSLLDANAPERLIVVIATAAIARVSRRRLIDLDQALASYVEVSKNISITPKGAPDAIAARHLRDAADELLRVGSGGRLKMAV